MGAQAEPDARSRRAKMAEPDGFESSGVGDHISLPRGREAVASIPPEQHRGSDLGVSSWPDHHAGQAGRRVMCCSSAGRCSWQKS